MPQNKLLKAGLEGLVKDNADNRSLVEQHPGAPTMSHTLTGKPASQSKAADAGSTCRFNTAN